MVRYIYYGPMVCSHLLPPKLPKQFSPKLGILGTAAIAAWLVEVAAIQNALGKQVIVRCFVVVPNLDGKAISSFLE